MIEQSLEEREMQMFWTIIGLLILLWVLGLVFKIAAGFVNILLIIAVILIVYKVIKGRTRG
ncbi:lmo0937 family membrane protein [Peribacillus psychrosaccharolyticus]|nr:lmo0937 family membrane protein [Peribacillus psychrosaccharolyticus]